MSEQFSNNAVTTLRSSLDGVVTSVPVLSAVKFPASAQYRVIVDDEIMIVTGGTGTTTWTVTRGAEGTSAVAHNNGASVRHTITAGALRSFTQAVATAGINVYDYGAIGNGVADDTAAIEAAWAVAQAATPNPSPLFFPQGTFVYNGTGLVPTGSAKVAIIGASRVSSKVLLGATSPFLLISTILPRCEIRGMWFSGGSDIIKATFTGADTTNDIRIIEDNFFDNFTGCAIQNNASDSAWWHILNNKFRGGNITSGIGIAIGGLADESLISGNSFDGQLRVLIKVTHGGPNVHITYNGLIFGSGSPTNPRAKVWIVPQPGSSTNSNGMSIRGNKFGNENTAAGDFDVLVADGTVAENGTTNLRGNIMPSTAVSSGFWVGATIQNNMFSNGGSAGSPNVSAWMYSYTAGLRGIVIAHNTSQGTAFNYIAQVDAGVTVGADRFNNDNLIIDNTFDTSAVSVVGPAASNQPGMFRLADMAQNLVTKANTVLPYPGGNSSAGFNNVLSASPTSYSTASGAAVVTNPVTDSLGGTDAAEFSVTTSTSSLVFKNLSTPAIGAATWVEFELKQGTSTPLLQIQANLRYGGSTQHWSRIVDVPTSWTRYRFLWYPREATSTIQFQFTSLGTAGSFQLGRAHIYQAHEPMLAGGMKLRSPNGTLYTLNVSDAGVLVVS